MYSPVSSQNFLYCAYNSPDFSQNPLSTSQLSTRNSLNQSLSSLYLLLDSRTQSGRGMTCPLLMNLFAPEIIHVRTAPALRRPCARVDSTLPRGYSRCIRSLYEWEFVMFEKKIEIFKKKDRAAWTEIRDLLKKEGVAGISAGHYLQESVMAGGCGGTICRNP